ncbi:MAG: DMT family transporter [Alphaproteobacteria bacterium]
MKSLSSRAQGLVAVNIAAVIFGSAALYGKLDVSPFWIVCVRAVFAAIALAVFGFYKRDIGLPPRNQWLVIIGTGVILAIHWLTFFASVQMAGVAVATLTFAAFPLFTLLIETVHQRRRLHAAEIAAALCIIVAVGLLINPQNNHGNPLGVGAGLISALTFAWFGYASKQLGRALSPLRISLVQNTVVATILVPFLFFVDGHPARIADWMWLLLLGVMTTAVMHQLYFYALRRLSASTCSGFVALEPVYAILFAAVLFHESITLWVILSAVLIVGASVAFLKLEPPL